jgi:hypothetical protein
MKGGLNIGSFGLERLGHGGESRDPNYNATANYFKEFLESESVGLMNEDDENTFEEWVEKNENAQELVCQKEVVEQFGTWMCDVAEKSNGEPLAAGTCLDYYSALKSIFNKVFPENVIFSGSKDQEWYTDMRYKSKNRCVRRDARRGVASQKQALPIGRSLVEEIVSTLWKENTTDSVRKACYIASNFNSCGRTGELANMCFDENTYWDYDRLSLFYSQKEMKTSKEKMNNFGSDAKTMRLDQYCHMSFYYIVGGGSAFINSINSHGKFLWTELYNKEIGTKGAATTFINKILTDVMPTEENKSKRQTAPNLYITRNTGAGIRRGAIDHMILKLNSAEVCAKSGHDNTEGIFMHI